MSVVRRLKGSDFDDFARIISYAYPGFQVHTKEEIEKLKQKLVDIHTKDPTVNAYGLFREGKLLGGMLLYDFKMNFHSHIIDVGGVGLVAVDFVHKKEKVCKEMITYYLNHYRERGIYMALLYPFRPDFYKKMGFGYGTKMHQYRVRPESLPRGKSKKHVTYLGEDDKQAMLNCYDRHFRRTHGMIAKRSSKLDRIFKNPKMKVVGYKDGEEVLGYVVFTFKQVDRENFIRNNMVIKEFVYENRDVLLELLTFLNSQSDQIERIIFNTQDEFFHYLLKDPRNGTNNLIPSVYHESNVSGVGLMYRIIDIKGIFEVLENHNFGGQSCKVRFDIVDTFLGENKKSVTIQFRDGRPQIKHDEDNYEVRVSMDISEFSSMFMGCVPFKKLYCYGLVEISDTSYIDIVNKLFWTREKPICTTEF